MAGSTLVLAGERVLRLQLDPRMLAVFVDAETWLRRREPADRYADHSRELPTVGSDLHEVRRARGGARSFATLLGEDVSVYLAVSNQQVRFCSAHQMFVGRAGEGWRSNGVRRIEYAVNAPSAEGARCSTANINQGDELCSVELWPRPQPSWRFAH